MSLRAWNKTVLDCTWITCKHNHACTTVIPHRDIIKYKIVIKAIPRSDRLSISRRKHDDAWRDIIAWRADRTSAVRAIESQLQSAFLAEHECT